ncbi:hypothetical protein AVEN_138073-1, partial [Araneus ventricosus]
MADIFTKEILCRKTSFCSPKILLFENFKSESSIFISNIFGITSKPPLKIMTQPDDAVNRPINYDLADLTSVGLALFDIRNWYACALRLVEVGKRYSWNMWKAFVNWTQQFNENVKDTRCAVCGPGSIETSPKTPRTVTRQVGNSSGGWVFVPDLKEFNPNKKSGTATK